jgi:hypothetical protein
MDEAEGCKKTLLPNLHWYEAVEDPSGSSTQVAQEGGFVSREKYSQQKKIR